MQPQGDSNECVQFPRQDDAIRSGTFVRRVRIICIGSVFADPKRREKDPARAACTETGQTETENTHTASRRSIFEFQSRATGSETTETE